MGERGVSQHHLPMSEEPASARPDVTEHRITDQDGDPLDLEWVGVAGGSHDGRVRFYDPSAETAYRGCWTTRPSTRS